jgi:hypothetical protein
MRNSERVQKLTVGEELNIISGFHRTSNLLQPLKEHAFVPRSKPDESTP